MSCTIPPFINTKKFQSSGNTGLGWTGREIGRMYETGRLVG